jgi:hypothetical protein
VVFSWWSLTNNLWNSALKNCAKNASTDAAACDYYFIVYTSWYKIFEKKEEKKVIPFIFGSLTLFKSQQVQSGECRT